MSHPTPKTAQSVTDALRQARHSVGDDSGLTRPLTVQTANISAHEAAAHQAFLILRTAFTIAPIIMGLDKFTGILVDWDKYLAPTLAGLSPLSVHQTFYVIGVIEIIAGIVVALHPRLGAIIVAAWLGGIILNLLLIPGYFDVAVRDFGLLLGALALQRLAVTFDPRPLTWPVARS